MEKSPVVTKRNQREGPISGDTFYTIEVSQKQFLDLHHFNNCKLGATPETSYVFSSRPYQTTLEDQIEMLSKVEEQRKYLDETLEPIIFARANQTTEPEIPQVSKPKKMNVTGLGYMNTKTLHAVPSADRKIFVGEVPPFIPPFLPQSARKPKFFKEGSGGRRCLP